MKPIPNTYEAIAYDAILIKNLVAENPAMVLAGAAMNQRRCFMASDILEASGIDKKIDNLIEESVGLRGYCPATIAYMADTQQQMNGMR